MDTQDKEFVAELGKRIQQTIRRAGVLVPIENEVTYSNVVKKALDSMIEDGIIGPMFHSEIMTTVEVDPFDKGLNVSFKHIAGEDK